MQIEVYLNILLYKVLQSSIHTMKEKGRLTCTGHPKTIKENGSKLTDFVAELSHT